MKSRLFTRNTRPGAARRRRPPPDDSHDDDSRADDSRAGEEPEARDGPSLREVSAEFFSAIVAFRAAPPESRPRYTSFRREITEFISEFERRAERHRLDRNGDARFALIALADETAMSTEWEGTSEWERDPLQVRNYGSNTAGDVFFERLNALRQTRGDPFMLEVYFHCLCAGFRGKYRDDPAALTDIRGKLFQKLPVPQMRDEFRLTPDAYGRRLERPLITRRFTVWWLLPFLLATVGLYFAYYVILEQQVTEIQQGTSPIAVHEDRQ